MPWFRSFPGALDVGTPPLSEGGHKFHSASDVPPKKRPSQRRGHARNPKQLVWHHFGINQNWRKCRSPRSQGRSTPFPTRCREARSLAGGFLRLVPHRLPFGGSAGLSCSRADCVCILEPKGREADSADSAGRTTHDSIWDHLQACGRHWFHQVLQFSFQVQ